MSSPLSQTAAIFVQYGHEYGFYHDVHCTKLVTTTTTTTERVGIIPTIIHRRDAEIIL